MADMKTLSDGENVFNIVDTNAVHKTAGKLTENLNLGGYKLVEVADPVADTDAAIKKYVDGKDVDTLAAAKEYADSLSASQGSSTMVTLEATPSIPTDVTSILISYLNDDDRLHISVNVVANYDSSFFIGDVVGSLDDFDLRNIIVKYGFYIADGYVLILSGHTLAVTDEGEAFAMPLTCIFSTNDYNDMQVDITLDCVYTRIFSMPLAESMAVAGVTYSGFFIPNQA